MDKIHSDTGHRICSQCI